MGRWDGKAAIVTGIGRCAVEVFADPAPLLADDAPSFVTGGDP